jgi:8-oxo-dGTP pyrophosphatase MutT (NUDIX family)
MIETLHANEWLSLKVMREPERGINGYVFSHETRCRGCIIAVLPYRWNNERCEYLVKHEVTPCWSLDPVLSALTGGWEGGPPVHTAQLELLEESGYRVGLEKFISLGTSYASKSSDTRYALFAVDLLGVSPEEVKGDGSRLEREAKSVWLTEEQLVDVKDPQVALMLNRLKHYVL